MKVLFLSLWYPNRYDAMSGLFVRKHAQAVAAYADVYVLYLCAHKAVKRFEIEEQEVHGVKEMIVYYPATRFIPTKIRRFLKGYRKGFNKLFKSWGKPDVVHANVFMRNAFMGYYLKKRYGIPYVVSEHWSRYLPENMSYSGKVRRKITEKISAEAECVMPVSTTLKLAMKDQGLAGANYKVVPNVVDDFFYSSKKESKDTRIKRLLHVSCFDERSKNGIGIVKAIALLSKRRTDFELVMAGVGRDWDEVKQTAENEGLLGNRILMVGEQTPEEIKTWFDKSDAFVLFSNYETAAVVLSESIATGTPIVTTPVGIAPVMVTNEVGIIVPINDSEVLCEALDFMLDHYEEFDETLIRSKGNEFTMERVGAQFKEIYLEALEPRIEA